MWSRREISTLDSEVSHDQTRGQIRKSKFIDQHLDFFLFVEPEAGRIFHPIMEIPN